MKILLAIAGVSLGAALISGAGPTARIQVASVAACQPVIPDTPTYRHRPDDTANDNAEQVSSNGTAGVKPCTCHRST